MEYVTHGVILLNMMWNDLELGKIFNLLRKKIIKTNKRLEIKKIKNKK